MKTEAGSRFRAFQAAAIAAVVLAPVAVVAILTWRYYVPIPFKDDWELAPSVSADSVSIRTLFHQHNEHVCFVPKLILTTLARATGWSMQFEPLLNILIVLVTAVALLMLAKRDHSPRSPTALVVAAFGCSVFLFSPAQYDVWLWPWMMTATITVSLVSLAAYFLGREGKGFTAAIICCLLAGLSTAQGLFAWLALGPAAAWRHGRVRRGRVWAWSIATAASWMLYFVGYQNRGATATIRENMAHPAILLEFVFTAIGAPWIRDASLTLVVGILQVALLLWAIVRLSRGGASSRVLALSGVASWALMFGVISALGRLQYGVETAATSRYLASTAIFTAVFFVLVALVLEQRAARSRLAIALVSVVFAAAAWLHALDSSVDAWQAKELERERGALCLGFLDQTGGDANGCIASISAKAEQTIDRVETLEAEGVRRFRRREPIPFAPADGWVGILSPALRGTDVDTIQIEGLLVDPRLVPNPGLILLDAGNGELWCCGFTDPDAGVSPSGATAQRKAVRWRANVPRREAEDWSEIGAWTLLRDPDRFVPLEGFVEVTSGSGETIYSASQKRGP